MRGALHEFCTDNSLHDLASRVTAWAFAPSNPTEGEIMSSSVKSVRPQRSVAAWLQSYRDQFLKSLADQGYTGGTLRTYGSAASLFCREVDRRGLQEGELVGHSLTKVRAATLDKMHPNKHPYKKFCLDRFISALIEAGAAERPAAPSKPPTALDRLRTEYETYLREQRGLTEATIYHCVRFLDRFMAFRFGAKLGNLNDIAGRYRGIPARGDVREARLPRQDTPDARSLGSRPNRRLGLRVLRPTQTTCRCSDKAFRASYDGDDVRGVARRPSRSALLLSVRDRLGFADQPLGLRLSLQIEARQLAEDAQVREPCAAWASEVPRTLHALPDVLRALALFDRPRRLAGQPGEGSDLPSESYRLDREAPILQGVPVASTASSR
jgi:hypothetical protein